MQVEIRRARGHRAVPAAVAALSAILSAGTASALAAFAGDADAFVVQDVSAELNRVDLDGTATLTPLFAPPAAGIEYNNMGFRRTDGLIYAVELNGTGLTGGNNGLIQVDSDGNITNLGSPVGLPSGAGSRFDAGDVSLDGQTMFVSFGFSTNTATGSAPNAGKLFKVDLPDFLADAGSLTAVTEKDISGAAGAVNDWAFNGDDGLLYGGDQTHGQLAVLDPDTGVRTDYAVTGLPSGTSFGAAWWEQATGHIFLYQNSGTVYEIDPSGTPSIVNTWSADASTRNDGATWVPEPATLILMTGVALGLLSRRRRKA